MDKDTILLYDIEFTKGQRRKKDAGDFLRGYFDELENNICSKKSIFRYV